MDYLINSCVSRIGQQLFGLIYTALPSGIKNEGAKKKKKKKRKPKLFMMLHSSKEKKKTSNRFSIVHALILIIIQHV